MNHEHEHEHHEHGHEHEHDHHHDGEDEQELDYVGEVEAFRAEKDDVFRHSPASPIPHEVRHDFTGLPYFAVDESLRFEGLTLDEYTGDQPTSFQIPTSDGQLKPAHRQGSFSFEIGGEPRRLTAYVLDGGHSHSLFVPFLDATSGNETYGAGRYLLDTAKSADLGPGAAPNSLVLDFNFAFHPSCAFDPQWSCPLAPPENILDLRVEAGERLA
jgi:uncharacterized protein (DUF1684 family)